MTSEDVIAVIDQLCDKLGLAVSSMSELVPELARLKIAESTYAICVCAVIAIVAIAILIVAYRHGKKWAKAKNKAEAERYAKEREKQGIWAERMIHYTMSDNEVAITSIILSSIAIITAIIVSIFNGWNLVKWLLSPTAAAIEYILSLT